MNVGDRHIIERQGVALVQSLAVNDLRWLFREQSVSDVGIDAHLEIVVRGGATGRLLALQIKSGDSYFREPVADGFVYRGDKDHLEYWLNHALPIVVVICRPGAREAYWQVISDDTVVRTTAGWKMVVPKANRFRSEAAESLDLVAVRQFEFGGPRNEMGTVEAVTHSDSILGALLSDPQLLDIGRCSIKTASITYTCSRIASLDDHVAVLVTANATDGTVFILRRFEDKWRVGAQLPISTKYAESLPAFFVRWAAGYCLVVQHPTGWGTGTLLIEEKWFVLSRQPRLVLEYPVHAYVVGWGLLFDRKIKGERGIVPSVLTTGAHLELTMKAQYSPSSNIDKYEGVNGFEVAKRISLEWDDSKGAFSLVPGSDMSPEETLGLYADDDAGFVTRNLRTLEALAHGAGGDLLTWIKDLAQRASPTESEVLSRTFGA